MQAYRGEQRGFFHEPGHSGRVPQSTHSSSGAAARSTSFDATKAFKKACIDGDLGSSRAFCLMPVAPDTVRIGGSLLIGEGPPPSSLQLTITDTETGTTLFDKKSIPVTNGYYVSLFLVDARS